MDFDLDDPLGDLLSDGSNDSFFGTSKKPEQQTTAKKSTPTSAASSSAKVANLFGIDELNETNTPTAIDNTTPKPSSNLNVRAPQSPFQSAETKIASRDSDINTGMGLGIRQSTMPSTPPSRFTETTTQQQQQRSIDIPEREPVRTMRREPTTQFDDSDDFLNELGFDPKHPKGSIAKKSNILDDILNFSKPDSLPKNTLPQPSTPMPPTPMPPDSRRSTKSLEGTNPSTNRYSPSLGSQGRPRRSGGSGPSVADPLGLFTTPTKKSTAPTETKSAEHSATSLPSTRSKPAKRSGIDWLGLGDGDGDDDEKPKDSVPQFLTETLSTTAAAAASVTDAVATVAHQSTTIQNLANPTTADVPISNDQSNPISNAGAVASTIMAGIPDMAATSLNLIHVASLEKEQAIHSLQQQQTQLRVAAQMKQQESMLQEMHRKQQMLIKQQENQFNELLQRQISRQSQLESHIQHQQEQINAYIGTLMSHPSISMTNLRMPFNGENGDHQLMDDGNDGGGGGSGRSNREIDEKQQHVIELEAEVKRLSLEKLRLEDSLQSVQASHEQELDILHSSHK